MQPYMLNAELMRLMRYRFQGEEFMQNFNQTPQLHEYQTVWVMLILSQWSANTLTTTGYWQGPKIVSSGCCHQHCHAKAWSEFLHIPLNTQGLVFCVACWKAMLFGHIMLGEFREQRKVVFFFELLKMLFWLSIQFLRTGRNNWLEGLEQNHLSFPNY